MRFTRSALLATALLALGSLQQHGVAKAEVTVTPETETPSSLVLENAEEHQFEAEVNKMLDIVINSLYTNKDIFLRELISNASDALDKLRFMSLTEPSVMDGNPELEVKISYNADAKTITITDTGIGMTQTDLVKNLGTVARSGTSKFLEALGDDSGDMGLIGMFGVGFYSSFLVADKVTVASKSPQEDQQYIWECVNGENTFNVGGDPRGNTLGRGTEITLHLKEDSEEYANEQRLMTMAKHFSEFITHPISVMQIKTVELDDEEDEDEFDDKPEDDLDVGDEDDIDGTEVKPKKEITTESWERVNTQKVIWSRSKDEITDEEYQSFYKTIAKDANDKAASWSHFDAEGNINFKSILYLPEESEQMKIMGETKGSVKLYVRKVLISDEFSLLPPSLSFIKGVVDSDDLPLNVNRETLQESKIIKIIKKKVIRKAIEMIRKFSEQEMEDDADIHPYNEWYSKFGVNLKGAAIEEHANRDRIMKLLRFTSSKSDGELVSFKEYIENLKEWQTEIYFFTGEDEKVMKDSHFMEKFKDKDVEVLFLTHPIDAYLMDNVRDFDNHMFKDVTKNVEFKDEDEDLIKRREKVYKKKFEPLISWLKGIYGKEISKITISKRLGKAPAIVTNGPYGQSAHVQQIMRSQSYAGNDQARDQLNMMKMHRELEINPRHPIVVDLLSSATEGDDETTKEMKDSAFFLLDTALLSGGFSLEPDDKFSERMLRVLQTRLGVESLELEEEINPPVEEDVPPEIDLDGVDNIDLEGFGEDEF